MSIKLVVADDDIKILSMLRRSLSYEGYQVETGVNGKEALELIRATNPDLAILDIMMPELDGIEVIKELRSNHNQVPILLLTAKDAVDDRVQGLDAGADDYLVKPFALEELFARVRALLRRKNKGQQGLPSFDNLVMDVEKRIVTRNNQNLNLVGKEFDLCKLFLENVETVLSRELIMEKVWGYDYEGESNVLEVYIANLRNKLEKDGQPRIIHTVRGVGYVLRK